MQAKYPILITAVPTVFNNDGFLDLDESRAMFEFVAESGVDGIFVNGTTGEFLALEREERRTLARLALQVFTAHGKATYIHVGAASAFQVRNLLDDVKEVGGTKAAVLTPYYFPATERAVVDFYSEIAKHSDGIEIYLYLFTERTGVAVSPSLLAELASLPGVRGAKISGESAARLIDYREAVPDDFLLFTGQDTLIGQLDKYGADGVVSGVAACIPEPFLRLRDIAKTASAAAIENAQQAVDEAVSTVNGDIGRIKFTLQHRGIVSSAACRMAIEPPDSESQTDLVILVNKHV